MIPDDDFSKPCRNRVIKIISVFGVSIVVNFIKILSGARNFYQFWLVPTGVKKLIAQLEIRVRNTPRHSRQQIPFTFHETFWVSRAPKRFVKSDGIWGQEWTPRPFANQLKVPMKGKLSLSSLKELNFSIFHLVLEIFRLT